MDYNSNLPTRLSKWLYLAVFVVGGLTVLAFAPFKIYPMAWFGPAFLFYALTKARTKSQYFKLGWVYGLGLFGAGTSWPFYSLFFWYYCYGFPFCQWFMELYGEVGNHSRTVCAKNIWLYLHPDRDSRIYFLHGITLCIHYS